MSAFIVVRDGTLEFAHVVRRRRRAGIATRLVEFAVQHHGLTAVSGILTDDGEALVAALRRDGVLPYERALYGWAFLVVWRVAGPCAREDAARTRSSVLFL